MELSTLATKGNLLAIKRSLELAERGYALMDKKRNILIMEMMGIVDKVKQIQGEIDQTFARAYAALQKANITLGTCLETAKSVPIEDSVHIMYRSIMGVEIPIVTIDEPRSRIYFGFSSSNSALDEAYICFGQVKMLCAKLAEVETSVYRLADAVRKTQRRANALNHIIIPRYRASVALITTALEEKEREEFSRLKIIKQNKERAADAGRERERAQDKARHART